MIPTTSENWAKDKKREKKRKKKRKGRVQKGAVKLVNVIWSDTEL
jgi:hypothetical protein